MSYPYKNLVFKGGGVLGVAYQGVYEVLDERNILPDVENVCGTSTGAIATLLICLEYTTEESKKILLDLDFRSLKDGGWFGIFRLFREFGWYKGDAFLNFFTNLCAQKTGNPWITFAELHNLGFKKPYIIATNISQQEVQVFSHTHTPQMPVALAARMSISVPYYFATLKYQGDVMVDGGVLLDYAIDFF